MIHESVVQHLVEHDFPALEATVRRLVERVASPGAFADVSNLLVLITDAPACQKRLAELREAIAPLDALIRGAREANDTLKVLAQREAKLNERERSIKGREDAYELEQWERAQRNRGQPVETFPGGMTRELDESAGVPVDAHFPAPPADPVFLAPVPSKPPGHRSMRRI